MHSSPNWRVDRARESLLLPILNFASTAFLICSLQSSFFSLRCLLPSELLLSAVFFLPNTKLKAYKNHHKDSEGRDFLFHINNAGFLSLITLCQKSIFCQKKNPHFLVYIFSIKFWFWHEKTLFRVT